jgi:hypothetical protein
LAGVARRGAVRECGLVEGIIAIYNYSTSGEIKATISSMFRRVTEEETARGVRR